MQKTFYLVDDDKGVRKILETIIADHELGRVIGTAGDGPTAVEEIPGLQPEIVLVDLLLPGIDGIGLTQELKGCCPGVSFIMLSQVVDKELISKAYLAGVDFFITKPINVVEVVSVIRRVQDKLGMEQVFVSLRQTIGAMEGAAPPDARTEAAGQARSIRSVLARLGILGEAGSRDLQEMCAVYLEQRRLRPDVPIRMNDLYRELARRAGHGEKRPNTATIEQRIRRTVVKALNNTASMGLEDYSNDTFTSLGGVCFDFAEVRRQMNYIRGTSAVPGKISVKKFIEGMATVIQHE